MAGTTRILVAPLDWGLGHASRCIPIIQALLQQGAEVIIASNGRALSLLEATFSNQETVKLPAYNIRYPSENMYMNMLRQSGKLLRVIREEHRQIQQLVHHYSIDAVISDNRFGCFSSKKPSIFITHQINLRLSFPVRKLAREINKFIINQYDTCWIPDIEGKDSLSGDLSTQQLKVAVRYLGVLSQLSTLEEECTPSLYDLLVLLSGPEPQRTYLEHSLLEQLRGADIRTLLVQGKTEEKKQYSKIADHIEKVSFLTYQQLGPALQKAQYVLCRSGYSSLMDLAVCGRKALLVPTPGQTEQIYLAQRMQTANYCPFQVQHAIDIESGLNQMDRFTGIPRHLHRPALLQAAVKELLEKV